MSAISEKKNVDLLCEAMATVTPKERAMSANPDLEKVLQHIVDYWYSKPVDAPGNLYDLLNARLLPILEAGQECRNQIFGAKLSGHEGIAGCTDPRETWDAALRAAMEAKP